MGGARVGHCFGPIPPGSGLARYGLLLSDWSAELENTENTLPTATFRATYPHSHQQHAALKELASCAAAAVAAAAAALALRGMGEGAPA